MLDANFTVSFLRGDMPQRERETILREFRSGKRYGTILAVTVVFFCEFPKSDVSDETRNLARSQLFFFPSTFFFLSFVFSFFYCV